jgi:hypothetical protein
VDYFFRPKASPLYKVWSRKVTLLLSTRAYSKPALTFGLSQFHGHGSWLLCEVALTLVTPPTPSIHRPRTPLTHSLSTQWMKLTMIPFHPHIHSSTSLSSSAPAKPRRGGISSSLFSCLFSLPEDRVSVLHPAFAPQGSCLVHRNRPLLPSPAMETQHCS